MRNFKEWALRQIWWRLPSQGTKWDDLLRGIATVEVRRRDRPEIDGKLLDDWQLQTIAMCPTGGRFKVARGPKAIVLTVTHPEHIETGHANIIEIRVDPNGDPYVYFDLVLFNVVNYPGFGAAVFYRAAQAAERAGFRRIELLAAGGQGYKYSWTRQFNGYHSWARYGFNADLWPETLLRMQGHPQLDGCTELLDIIERDPGWWKQHGDGCDLTFDLASDSRSWYTLLGYLSERGLV